MADDATLDDLVARAVTACVLARTAGAAIQRWSEQHLRQIRAAGQLLALVERSEGGRPKKNASRHLTPYQQAVQQAGISRQTASEWRRVGEIADDAFEAFVAATKGTGRPFTQTALFAHAMPRMKSSSSKRTLRLTFSEREYLTVRRQLETLGAAYFADGIADALVTIVGRDFQRWLGEQRVARSRSAR